MEEGISKLFQEKEASGTTHLGLGQEATPIGVISNLHAEDYAVGTYRGHLAALAKGVPMREIVAEILGKSAGCNSGFGGSMHLTKENLGLMGNFSVVGAGIPVAAGLGLASRLSKEDRVTACFFGDGAINTGYFHEGLNLAAVHSSSVLFCLENNQYGEHTSLADVTKVQDINERVKAYGIRCVSCDGNDVEKVCEVTESALKAIRIQKQPFFIEFKTYRTSGHAEIDEETEGSSDERAYWLSRDPIQMLRSRLFERRMLDEEKDNQIQRAVENEVEDSIEFARGSPWPKREDLMNTLFVKNNSLVDKQQLQRREHENESAGNYSGEGLVRTNMRFAIRSALKQSMERDSKIVVFGEDVAKWGGVFKVTKGLLESFGPDRVWDSPISEGSLVGMAMGLALAGFKPAVEIMFSDFILLAADALGNGVAKKRFLSGGQSRMPVIVRTACGAQSGWGATHSQVFDTLLLSTPGIKIATPSNAVDAKGLLCAALAGADPVIFFEHKELYQNSAMVDSGYFEIPLGLANVIREGADVTVVANMRMVKESLEAARILEGQGISVELIDLRTIVPLDVDTILSSVKKTGKLVTVEESPISAGWGNLVLAQVAEKGLYYLERPMKRIALADLPIVFSPFLEKEQIPTADNLAKQIAEVCTG